MLRNTLIIGLVLLGFGAYVYYYEMEGGKRKARVEAKAKKLFHLNLDNISTIGLTTRDTLITLKKYASDWKIIEPIITEVDQTAVDRLIANLKQIEREEIISKNTDQLEKYGLGEPLVTIRVTDRDEETESVYLGDKNPTGSFAYVKKEGEDAVVLVKAKFRDNTDKGLFELRNKKFLLDFDKEAVNKIIYQKKGKKRVVCKKVGVRWVMVEPVRTRADDQLIDDILGKVEIAKTNSFVDDKPIGVSKYGLEPPSIRIEFFWGSEKQSKSIRFGKRTERGVYAKDDSRPTVFIADSTLVADYFKKDANQFRGKYVAYFKPIQIDEIQLTYLGTTFVCQKDTTGVWHVKDVDDQYEAKKDRVGNILNELAKLQVKEFVDDNPEDLSKYGLANPVVTVVFKSHSEEIAILFFGKEKGDKFIYTKSSAEKYVFLVSSHIMKNLKIEKLEDIVATLEQENTI